MTNLNKNKPIVIGLTGIGAVILYQVLLNFLLPIALFVFLLYVLKILIKGFEKHDEPEESKSALKKPDSSSENNVPNQPIKAVISKNKESIETKPLVEVKPIEKEKSDDINKPE